MPIFFISHIVAYIDHANIGSLAKLQMLDDLHFSAAVYGFGSGVFFVGFLLFEVPSNLILYRVGARKWIARIMLTWGLISMLTLFVKTPMAFYTMRFLLGAAGKGISPGVVYYLTPVVSETPARPCDLAVDHGSGGRRCGRRSVVGLDDGCVHQCRLAA